MADEAETQAPTTLDSPLVSKPFVSAKPYDDDMFDAYEATEPTAEEQKPVEEPKAEEPKAEEAKEPEQKAEPAKEPEQKEVPDAAIEETAIKRAINGKEVEFKVKDAIQAYVKQEEFNRNMDRRLTHVSQREKRFLDEQTKFKSVIDKVIEVTQGGDFIGGVRALAKLAAGNSKADVVEFEKKYFAQLDKVRDVYSKMTPEQQEAYFAKRAAAEAQERASRLEDEKSAQVEISQLQAKVNKLTSDYGIPEAEFWKNYKALESSQVGEGKAFAAPNDIKPEDVISFSLRVRHEEKVLQAGEKIGVTDDAVLDEVVRLTLARPDLSVDDIAKIIEDAGLAKTAKPQAVENLNRKAEKSNARFNQASSTKKENGKIDGLDTEDLEFLYRKQPKAYARPVR